MKEEDIRKRELFDKYLEIVARDIVDNFDFNSFVSVNCPSCSSSETIYEFDKDGFKYVSCKNCDTLFINPRPPFYVLKRFYSESISTHFFVNDFLKPVIEIRREKIFKPRAEYIKGLLDKKNSLVIGDIGAGFGLFLEELRKMLPANKYIAIEPSLEMSQICQGKGLEVNCSCLEDIDNVENTFDLLTAFELIEHLYEPSLFFKKIYSMLRPEGYIYLTTLNGLGFDLLLLWNKSKSISPPHHLNFFNPASIEYLMKDIGFEIIESSTPGKLDWDIIEGMIKNEGVDCGRFWNLLAKDGSEKSKNELQDWISKNNLSSHMSILAKKA